MTRSITAQPTWVYRLICEHGGPLYVGIAIDLDRRLAQHRAASKPWWPDVARVEAEQYPDRYRARLMESYYIVYERPLHNVSDKPALPRPPARRIKHRHYTITTEQAEAG